MRTYIFYSVVFQLISASSIRLKILLQVFKFGLLGDKESLMLFDHNTWRETLDMPSKWPFEKSNINHAIDLMARRCPVSIFFK